MAKDTAMARVRHHDGPGWGAEAIVCLWAWLVMAGCFAGLAMHAASGHIARTDLRLLNASQHLPRAIQPWVTLQEHLGSPQMLSVGVALLALLLFARRAWLEGIVTLSAFGVFGLAVLIKHLVQEAPPYLASHAAYEGILESNYSFPSGHVVGLSVLAGLVFLFADRLTRDEGFAFLLRLASFVVAASVGPGRIYLGVHYPSDVVAAYLLAGLYLLPLHFAFAMWRRTMLRRHGTMQV